MATLAPSTRINVITLASASAGPFLVGFRLFEGDALEIYVDADLQDSGYTVLGTFEDGYDDDATIVFSSTLSSGSVIHIIGGMTPQRSADYLITDGLLTQKLNIELARSWATISEAWTRSRQGLRVLGEASIPAYAPDDQKAPIWDAASQSFINGPSSDEISNAQSYANAASTSASESASSATAAEEAADRAEAAEATVTRLYPKRGLIAAEDNDGTFGTIEIAGVYDDIGLIDLYLGRQSLDYGEDYSISNDGTSTTIQYREGGVPANFPPGETIRWKGAYQVASPTADAEAIFLPNGVSAQDSISPSYASRAAVVADIALSKLDYLPDGALVSWVATGGNVMVVRREDGATGISDMPGFSPSGLIYPDIWKDNATPGTTDMSDALRAMATYLADSGKQAILLPVTYYFDATSGALDLSGFSLMGSEGYSEIYSAVDAGSFTSTLSGTGPRLSGVKVAGYAALSIDTATRPVIEHCDVGCEDVDNAYWRNGITLNGTAAVSGAIIRNNRIHHVNIGMFSAASFGSADNDFENFEIYGNEFYRTKKVGLSINADPVVSGGTGEWKNGSIHDNIFRDHYGADAIAATALVSGTVYEIATAGTTDFTLIGAANSTPGTTFTATGAGTGTGTAAEVVRCAAIAAEGSYNVSIRANTIDGYGEATSLAGYSTTSQSAIHLESYNNGTSVADNILSGVDNGIAIYPGSTAISVTDNVIIGSNGHSFGDDVSTFDDPTDPAVAGTSKLGISVVYATNPISAASEVIDTVTISGNYIENLGTGIAASGAEGSAMVTGNTVALCGAAFGGNARGEWGVHENNIARECKFVLNADRISNQIFGYIKAVGCGDLFDLTVLQARDYGFAISDLSWAARSASVAPETSTVKSLFDLPDRYDVKASLASHLVGHQDEGSFSYITSAYDGTTVTASRNFFSAGSPTGGDFAYAGSSPLSNSSGQLALTMFNASLVAGGNVTAAINFEIRFKGLMAWQGD